MRRLRLLTAALALAAGAVLLPGCGSSTATVFGEVTYEGEPVGDGYVTFTPADGKGSDAGAPITGGRFHVAGLPPGPKRVKVIAVRKVNFASTSEEMKQRAAAARRAGRYDGLVDPADTIAADAEGNNALVDLKPGDNRKDLRLKKPPTGKRAPK